jgi:hypothetical protein
MSRSCAGRPGAKHRVGTTNIATSPTSLTRRPNRFAPDSGWRGRCAGRPTRDSRRRILRLLRLQLLQGESGPRDDEQAPALGSAIPMLGIAGFPGMPGPERTLLAREARCKCQMDHRLPHFKFAPAGRRDQAIPMLGIALPGAGAILLDPIPGQRLTSP